MAKKNIKGEILNMARHMFNRLGCDNVSLRDIGGALNISVGNLTYHFARKEDLANALTAETRQSQQEAKPAKTLQQLNALFAILQNEIIYNAFLFWHTTLLAQSTPAITLLKNEISTAQCDVLKQSLENLHAAGLITPPCYNNHYSHLAHGIHLLCVFWIPHSGLLQQVNEKNQAPQVDYLQCLWSCIYPFLTDEGRKIYAEKVLKVRMEFE